MDQLETDIVLSAIRRGEDSLPKLRAATGLEYAKLHDVVYKLEFDFQSIRRTETPDGFDRFALANSGKKNGTKPPASTAQAIPPSAYSQTKAGNHARAVTLIQRDAPYCTGCRGFCVFDGLDLDNRVHWRCKPCNVVFEGSLMGRIEPEETKIPEMRDRVPLGPEEEAAIDAMREDAVELPRNFEVFDARNEQPDDIGEADDEVKNWRSGMCQECGAPAKSKTGNICVECQTKQDAVIEPCRKCGEPTPYGIRHRRMGHCRECYKDRLKDVREANKIARQAVVDAPPEFCGCGRKLPHGGRCAFRRDNPKERNVRAPKSQRIIAKPITSNGDGDVSDPANKISAVPTAVAENPVSVETKKAAVAKSDEIIPRNIPATVDGQGVVLYDSIDDCVSEVVNWPKERVVEFFESLAKAIGLPQRPMRTEIKLAWSKDFESCDPEGTTGLTYLYLVSMLHHRMDQHEKEAVWTLIQYLKRIECANEDRKEQNATRPAIK